MSDKAHSTEFGFFPQKFDKTAGSVSIQTLPDLESKIHNVASSNCREGQWIYAPRSQTQDLSGAVRVSPYGARVFGLPRTHRIFHSKSDGIPHLRFLVLCFGFLVGMRMSETEAGFLDATPIVAGETHDIIWHGDSLLTALEHADWFWGTHAGNQHVEAAMRGAIHSYLISRTPTLLEFEEFIYLYTSLEGCHCVHSLTQNTPAREVPHNERIARLCEAFSIPTPPWADARNSVITRTRNFTLHEGLFFDEPLGFQLFGGKNRTAQEGMLLLQMAALATRLIIAILGMETCEYVRSPIDTRQRYGVRL